MDDPEWSMAVAVTVTLLFRSIGGKGGQSHGGGPSGPHRISACTLHARNAGYRIYLHDGRTATLHQQSESVRVLGQRIRSRHVLQIAPLLRTRHSRVINLRD